jgi:hypothetical protein
MLAHNFYRSSAPSGEDVVFGNERDLLKRNGVETISYEKYNDRIEDGYINRLALGVRTAWSKHTYGEVAALAGC